MLARKNSNGNVHPRNAAVIRQLKSDFGLDINTSVWEKGERQRINGSVKPLQVERIMAEKLNAREDATRIVTALDSDDEVSVVRDMSGMKTGKSAIVITEARSGIGLPSSRFILTKIVDW